MSSLCLVKLGRNPSIILFLLVGECQRLGSSPLTSILFRKQKLRLLMICIDELRIYGFSHSIRFQ